MSIREDVAVRMIEERARLGYSQSDFARQLEVSTETIRRYENGQREAGVEFLARAAGLGTDVQYVLTGVKSDNLKQAEKATQPLVHIESGGKANVIQGVSGGVINFAERNVTQVKAEVKPNDEHISDEQAFKLKRLVEEIVEMEKLVRQKPKSHVAIWSALNSHMRVTRYRLIPFDKYEKAEKYLRMWMGRLSSAKSAPKKANNEWRNRKYAYIKINTRDIPAWLDTYLTKNFRASSITKLNDKELEKVYRAVSSKRSRDKKK